MSVASLKGKMTASRMKSPPLSEIWKSGSGLSNDKIRKLQKMTANTEASNNGGEERTRLITDAETLSTLECYGKSYDDLRAESAFGLKPDSSKNYQQINFSFLLARYYIWTSKRK